MNHEAFMEKGKVFKSLMTLLLSALVLHISIPAMAGSNVSSLVDQGVKAYNSGIYAKAKKDFQKACDGGDADGCNNLGFLYENGKGVNRDYSKAKEFYGKACDGGYTMGCNDYTTLKKEGVLIPLFLRRGLYNASSRDSLLKVSLYKGFWELRSRALKSNNTK